MILEEMPFVGICFFEGTGRLPGDLVIELGSIREWANSQGMISDPEFQLMGPNRMRDVFRVWSPDDRLSVAISISDSANGSLTYMEYPYVPVRSLIQRKRPIQLIYWSVLPSRWDSDGRPLAYDEARFGFWVSNCKDEFCSSSNAKLVVSKFARLVDSLDDTSLIITKSDGAREVTQEGAYVAEFRKAGRQFDIEISPANGTKTKTFESSST
jgi:hypothetical protein